MLFSLLGFLSSPQLVSLISAVLAAVGCICPCALLVSNQLRGSFSPSSGGLKRTLGIAGHGSTQQHPQLCSVRCCSPTSLHWGSWPCAHLSRSHCSHVSLPFSSTVALRALSFALQVSFPFSSALPFLVLFAEPDMEFLAGQIPLKGESWRGAMPSVRAGGTQHLQLHLGKERGAVPACCPPCPWP